MSEFSGYLRSKRELQYTRNTSILSPDFHTSNDLHALVTKSRVRSSTRQDLRRKYYEGNP